MINKGARRNHLVNLYLNFRKKEEKLINLIDERKKQTIVKLSPIIRSKRISTEFENIFFGG
jgi:hypothetical protein